MINLFIYLFQLEERLQEVEEEADGLRDSTTVGKKGQRIRKSTASGSGDDEVDDDDADIEDDGDDGSAMDADGAYKFREVGNDDEDHMYGYKNIDEMQHEHEKKVLQLTQMHCELIELNEHLQSQIRTRDAYIAELEMHGFRGSWNLR